MLKRVQTVLGKNDGQWSLAYNERKIIGLFQKDVFHRGEMMEVFVRNAFLLRKISPKLTYLCNMGRMTMKLTRRALGHSPICSLVHSHHSLIRLLRTALASIASLTRTRSRAHGKKAFVYDMNASIS